MENGKRKLRCIAVLSRKSCDPKDLEKQNQYY